MKNGLSASRSEGMKIARLLMVMSSMSPLFVLWAIRGQSLVPEGWFLSFCLLMIILPNFVLYCRVRVSKKNNDQRELVVGAADDHRDHILVYLFAMLMPFYSEDVGSARNMVSTLVALFFIIFLFWHMNLHYMNFVFALLGYRVFTLSPPVDNNPVSGRGRRVLITRQVFLSPGDKVFAYRLSDTVFLEASHGN